MTQIQFPIWQDMPAWFVSCGNISIELIHGQRREHGDMRLLHRVNTGTTQFVGRAGR
jgi:hypothetical protein